VVRKDDGSTSVDQTEYIEKKARLFKCDGPGRTPATPMDVAYKVGKRPENPDKDRVALARSLMGSLIYATITRQECKYACSKLATTMTNPTEQDIKAMKRVLRYLYGTRNTVMCFRPDKWTDTEGVTHDPLTLVVYVDAGFGQEEGRRSQTGYTAMLCGSSVLSKSGKQTQMTDSTGYAETVALHEALIQTLVLRRQLERIFAKQERLTIIYEDNAAAVRFASKGPGPRSLHWDVKLEYIHEFHSNRREVHVRKADTKKQLADVFTKALPYTSHSYLTQILLGSELVFDATLCIDDIV
jgi:hypothetical protein